LKTTANIANLRTATWRCRQEVRPVKDFKRR
jgi:hypothetical protein